MMYRVEHTMSMTLFSKYVVFPFARMFDSLFCHMMRQQELNDLNLQQANGRVPPAWGPEHERSYSFRYYEADTMLWCLASDMDEARKGPALALRLTGAAKMIIRELDPTVLVQGQVIVDDQGQQVQLTGVQALLRILRRRYAPLDQEAQLHAVSEFFSFGRQGHEDTDQCVARFEVVTFRAEQVGGAMMNQVVLSWMLMHHLRIPKDRWPVILLETAGRLPNTPAEYQQFLLYVRRNGHLFDRNNDGAKNLAGQQYFVDHSNPDAFSHDPPDFLYPSFPSYSDGSMQFGSYFPVFDEESLSSGNSNDESAVDLSDLAHLSYPQAAETAYLGFRIHKRRWRKFAGPRKSTRKGKGKSKGKGKTPTFSPFPSKGSSGKRSYFGNDDSWTGASYDANWQDPNDLASNWDNTYFTGKGKGNGTRSGNPIGRDGKKMLCSLCLSPDHFIAKCPQNNGKGKGKQGTFLSSETWPTPTPISAPSSSQPPPTRGVYMAVHDVLPVTEQCTIQFTDGTPSISFSNVRERSYMSADSDCIDKAVVKQGFFPWWETALNIHPPDPSSDSQVPCYHSSVRLKDDREGLVIDTGAVTSITGDEWVGRSKLIGEKNGHGTSITDLERPFGIEGVGKGSNDVRQRAVVPIALQHGIVGTFQANVVANSPIPALCGLNPLIAQKTLLDLYTGRMILLGAGGYDLKLSPGSVVLDLEKASTGHLILPTTAWDKAKSGGQGKGIALLTL